ncbi:adenosine receptor A3-like [Stylophora pistillata]|uniref:adenosine receptor A3-like n=1 Tax=Stylophora pistillata TaxID=50429 RepID=UPI000C042646|nr:adenosine receptor A3-like [Stylophora pistillata]XP_022779478.1 adenosine receptor A3-like [Stylophora pistillata]
MTRAKLSGVTGKQTETLTQLRCVAGWTDEIHKHLIFISAFNIFVSLTAFLGNTLILVALHKESSLHPPSKLLYRSLATTDLCVGLITGPNHIAYLLSLVDQNWRFCRYALSVSFIAGHSLSSVSLLTMTAISVDRLLALLLELRYRQVVTVKRTCAIVIILWVVSIVAGASYFMNHRIAIWYSYIVIPLSLAIAVISYTKIFHTLHQSHYQVQIHILQQHSQPLNMIRYRKAVYSALWVQLALVVCYLPYTIARSVLPKAGLSPSQFLVWGYTATLVYANSSLNPFLYCWKINEIRQGVKETIRRALCCPWS